MYSPIGVEYNPVWVVYSLVGVLYSQEDRVRCCWERQ